MSLQGGGHLLVPDRVAGQVQGLFLRVLEDDAADLAEHSAVLGQDLGRAVPAHGFVQGDPAEIGAFAENAHIKETRRADLGRIPLVLGEHGQVLGQQGPGRLVPVVRVGVGDQDRVHVEQLFQRYRQGHGGVGGLAVHGAGKAGKGALVGEHGVDEEPLAAVVEAQGGVTNLGAVHGDVPVVEEKGLPFRRQSARAEKVSPTVCTPARLRQYSAGEPAPVRPHQLAERPPAVSMSRCTWSTIATGASTPSGPPTVANSSRPHCQVAR